MNNINKLFTVFFILCCTLPIKFSNYSIKNFCEIYNIQNITIYTNSRLYNTKSYNNGINNVYEIQINEFNFNDLNDFDIKGMEFKIEAKKIKFDDLLKRLMACVIKKETVLDRCILYIYSPLINRGVLIN